MIKIDSNKHSIFVRVWTWFQAGYAPVSLIMAVITTILNFVETAILKGIQIPTVYIVIVFFVGIIGLTLFGYHLFKTKFSAKMTVYAVDETNPQFVKMIADIDEIKRLLTERESVVKE